MSTKEDLLIHASELYYEQGLSQNEIAELLSTSRPTVSRLLDEAREEGIVEIIVHSPVHKNPDLSSKLRNALHLKEAIVVAGTYDYDNGLKKCGSAAAHFLNTILDNNMTVGIPWGPATDYLCAALEPKEYYNVNVIQMVGCLGTGNPRIDGLELAIRISSKLKGTYSNIYAPAFVDNELVFSYLKKEPQIKASLVKASRADIVMTGVGSLFHSESTLQQAGYLTEQERQALLSRGGVGHLLARAFDGEGRELFIDGKYTMSAPLEALKSASWSVGISASEVKAPAVLAAVRAGYLNTLIVDEALASKLLSADPGRL